MNRLDCSSAEVKAALEEVSSPTGANEWAVFGYVPKSGNIIKVDEKGSGFDDMTEEFSEGKVQFAYYRVMVKGAAKFVYVAWCGEGVTGMAKGGFANHSNDFAAHLKKGFAVHHQVNARSEADLDEKKIQAALVKAAGANYDAGAKKQGMDSTAKAMGELKSFHISEQARAVEVGTGRDMGSSGVAIDKAASDQYWQANKAQPKAAAPPPSRPAVDEEARKQFWQQDQAAKASAAKKAPAGRPAPAVDDEARKQFWQQDQAAKASSASQPTGRPTPGGGAPPPGGASNLRAKFEAGASAPPTSAPPPSRPAPGGPPKLPPSAPPTSAPPVSAPPPARPAPAAAPLPPRMPEPEESNDDDWGDDSAPAAAPPTPAFSAPPPVPAHAPAQEEYAQEEYAQEEYAQEEYAGQEEYAQEEYAQEEYAAAGQEEYAQEEYAQEEYAQEEYAQEEYAQDSSAFQVQALHDYAGQHAEDLSFSAGDWITVHERDDSGWWKGEINGLIGYFPSNFVQQ